MNLRHSSCSLAIAEVHILPVENAELQDALQTRTLVVRTCGGLAQGITPKPFHPKNAIESSAGKFSPLARLQRLGLKEVLMHLSCTEHLKHLLHARGGRIERNA